MERGGRTSLFPWERRTNSNDEGMPLIHAFLRPLADHTAVARVIQLVEFDETGTDADLFKLGDEFPLPALVQSALENTSLDAEAETLQHLFAPLAPLIGGG